MSRWLRINEDCIDNPKILKLPEALRWQWVALLCVASKNDGVLPPIDDVALCLRVPEAKAAEFMTKLVKARLIDNVDGVFRPHNWDKRQYKRQEPDLPVGDGDHKGKYIYFVGSLPGAPIKIGISKNPWARVVELQTSHPDKLSLIATFRTKGPSEADLHLALERYRRNGEWFDLPQSVMGVVAAAHTAKSDYASLLLLLRSCDVAAPITEQSKAESEAEHSRADARELDEIGLKQEGLLRAAFTAECASRPKSPDMAIIKTWLLDGISVGTISKTVPPILRRKLDMASLSYCDAAVRSEHAKTPAASAGLQVVSQQVFIVEGTMEWACWDQHLRSTTGRGSPVTDNRDEGGRLRRGWFRPTIVPEGYDEATGERIAPASEEHAA